AIKFTATGRITFAARQLFASSTKASVQFIVRDTGIGISKDKHKEIFESFTQADLNTTRKYGGTGLGLSITRKLVARFNSDLFLESEQDKGSTFHFTLEMKLNESNRKMYISDGKSRELESLSGYRILIAEDNPVNMSIAKRFLTKWGVEVTEATNGREAVEKFRNGSFNLLLIDLEMPEMDGATALREIQRIDPNTPAIAFTAAVYDNMQFDLISKGFVDFVPKPFRPEDLHSKISGRMLAKTA
ncbi:MAG: response regulator, partial [Chitinophagaceae bacterium]